LSLSSRRAELAQLLDQQPSPQAAGGVAGADPGQQRLVLTPSVEAACAAFAELEEKWGKPR
jgi:hypothetical protein